jgi:PAS domain S-box-containing protein
MLPPLLRAVTWLGARRGASGLRQARTQEEHGMTLRTKTLLIVSLVLSTLLMGMFLTSRQSLRARFSEIERQESEETAGRTRAVISSMLDEVDSVCLEWSQRGQSATQQALESLRINARAEFRGDGEPVSLMAWEPGHAGAEFPPALLEYINANKLWSAVKPGGSRGLVCVLHDSGGRGAMLVSVHPISRQGSGGVLLMGRWLDTPKLVGLTQSSAMILPRDEEGADPSRVVGLNDDHAPVAIASDPQGTVISTTLMRDLAGHPSLALECYGRRLVAEQAATAVAHVGTDLLAAGITSTALVFLLLGWLVLGRLGKLSRDLDAISRADRRRVDVRGSDEVSRVAAAINRTMDALDRSHAHLVESEARFRSMADSSPLGVYLTGPDGTPLYVNPAAKAMIGRDMEAVIMHRAWSEAVHDRDRVRVIGNWQRAVEERRAFREQYRMVHADGRVVWVTSHAAPIERDGQLWGFVGTIEDTTARLQAQDDLRRAKREAEAANLAKTEFLANMSHEIRTPMTAILGFADLMSDPAQDEAARRSCLETIRRNGEHLLAIINDILDISRIEAGRMSVESVPCSPAAIVSEVAALLEVKASAKGVAVEVAFRGPVPATVQCDPLRLRQMLTNLVGNAVKFTEHGSVRIVIGLEHSAGPFLRFEIIDSGIGISPEKIPLLFKPFTQADGSMARRFGGTGLGLSICAKLASILGGTIGVRSELGKGSTFTLRLPTGPLENVEMLRDPPRRAPVGHPTSSAEALTLRARVLLAEDGQDNQRLVSFLLIRAGAEVEVASNGQLAMEMALGAVRRGKGFDLILMDMQMPEMDGYAATRALRERGYKGMIVALTAHTMADDRTKCLEAGCDDFASKPIDRDTFIAKCAQWAKGRARAA